MNATTAALHAACAVLGVEPGTAELIRAGENTLYRLPGHRVARITRPDGYATAAKELRVARWLADNGISVVTPTVGIVQPIEADGRAVTVWNELPPHRRGTVGQLADALRAIHALPLPAELGLPPLAPFIRLHERITAATTYTNTDRRWLLDHLQQLQDRYTVLTATAPVKAVHGDAWSGNIVTTPAGPIILDLERFAIGPSEWDLTAIAVDHVTFASLTDDEWQQFCDRYGRDVTTWHSYELLRDIRELRKVTFAAQMADQHPHVSDQARYRLACLQGRHGSRPWHWRGVP